VSSELKNKEKDEKEDKNEEAKPEVNIIHDLVWHDC